MNSKEERIDFMEKQRVSYLELEGSYEEIGKQLAKITKGQMAVIPSPEYFSDKELDEAIELYEMYCPGLAEELEGYAKECGVSVRDLAFTWMTYLVPRCSGLVVSGELMNDGHTRLIRNYEFSIEQEDLRLCHTKPKGRYAHIGGGVALFGRTEGINECGLAVSMSSCGIPVSNIDGMRPPKVKGLQFWAVIRSILENCKNVKEALALAEKMPIAYNINLYLADSDGNGCLIETLDGQFCYEEISCESEKQHLCGTNHIAIPSFQKFEPFAMRNSLVRLQTIQGFMEKSNTFEERDIKELFLAKYPEGMSVNCYDEWFGTIKSVVMDTVNCSYQICWFGQKDNGWEEYGFDNVFENKVLEKQYEKEAADPSFFERVEL
jgi:predicted choloylglycine hydrolase